jgi:lipid II:glycine glycyltransferase (peptidoglycan interpeptide bridge formation enzyme)
MNRCGDGLLLLPTGVLPRSARTLGDRLHLCTVQDPCSGVLASAGLFTAINTDIIQWHLCGTASAYLPLAPTKLEIDFIRRWAKEAGYQALHLGGGVGNRADSLFHFKAGFSPVYKEFYTYRLVLDDNRYAELSRMWQARTRIPRTRRATYSRCIPSPWRGPLAGREGCGGGMLLIVSL